MRATLNPGVRPVEAWAWAMYDFANSGYTTVVITAVFNAYFVATVAGNAPWATLAWTSALAVSYALIMLTAPGLGAYADLRAAKKRLLAFTTLGCVAGTAALGWVGPGDLWLGIALVVVSNYFFGTGENLIAAFLPELARGRALGRLSGLGWGVGYLGGLLTLGLCLAYVTHALGRGDGAEAFVPATLWITAGVFVLASLPTFLFLRERVAAEGAMRRPVGSAAGRAYARMLATLGHARDYPDLYRFLACIVLYQAGVQAVIALAAVYAQQALGFTTQDSIQLILAVNVAAAAGALAFGPLQDRLGHRPALALTLVGWLATVLLAWRAVTPGQLWPAAGLAGLCLGASQSGGRALVGYLSPWSHRAEFFGLWGVAVKLAAILGPVSYGAVVWWMDGQHRPAMLVLGVFFLAGLALLAGVDPRRGRRRALRARRGEVKLLVAGAPPLG
ncbi:MAG TPA: MFS transporter [Thiobacillaceae bacterium]|nr:MFS transporter [Thiobacillaceae bacterium]